MTDDYNKMPDDFREVTEDYFVRHSGFFHYVADKYEFRQFCPSTILDSTKRSPLVDAKLWFYSDGTGAAMMQDQRAGKIRYFVFGCDHKWKHTRNLGRCFNEYKCEVCGQISQIDTSD